MKTMRLVICFILCLFSSCAVIPKTSQFSKESIHVGMKQEDILEKFGVPFMMDTYFKNGDKIDVFYFKEPVRVANCGYIITSTLFFQNSVLKKVTQEEKYISTNDINIETKEKGKKYKQ